MHRKERFIDPSVNSGYLDISDHCPPDAKRDPAVEPLLKLKTPADGNCGFYSIALGLMNLILQDKLSLAPDDYARFLSYMRNEAQSAIQQRAEYYRTGFPAHGERVRLEKCIDPLMQICEALNNGHLADFSKFKNYLLNNHGYYQVLAMAIYLAPALRALSISLLHNTSFRSLSRSEGVSLIETPEPRDGKDAEFHQLNLLAGFFGFRLISYNRQQEPLEGSYGDLRPERSSFRLEPQNAEEKKGTAAEDAKEVEPLSGLPTRKSSASLSPPLGLGPSPAAPAGKETKDIDTRVVPHELMPVISLAYSDRPGHWDLLLPWSSYLSPPFHFGFDFEAEGVDFEPEHIQSRKKRRQELQQAQVELARERARFLRFRQEIIKLKIEISQFTGNDFDQGKRLTDVLENNLNALFTPRNAPQEHQAAQQAAFEACTQAVLNANTYFRQNHTSPSFLNVLANIGLFLLGFALAYTIVAGIHYKMTGRIGFFHKPKLAGELPAFSRKLVELHQERVNPRTARDTADAPPKAPEPLPAFPEWSSCRIG